MFLGPSPGSFACPSHFFQVAIPGLLAAALSHLRTSPACPQVSSASIPFSVGAVLSLVLIPQDNLAESFLSYTLALVFGGAFAALFVGGFVLKALQDE